MSRHNHECGCGCHEHDHECGCQDHECECGEGCCCEEQIESFDGFEDVVGSEDAAWIVEAIESDGESLLSQEGAAGSNDLLMQLALSAFEGSVEEIKEAIFGHMDIIVANLDVPSVRRMVCAACLVAVRFGDGVCANFVGSMHYNGTGTPQDYGKAYEWYELSSKLGCSQGMVNLGYCYYYGRGCQVDYAQAFRCFAQAATLDQHPEAYMKLGDMHARGYFVDQDMQAAFNYYKKALELCEDDAALSARPQHHLADMMLEGVEGVVEADPFVALQMFQKAEIGYYFAINEGMTYYKNNLQEVIRKQEVCRKRF